MYASKIVLALAASTLATASIVPLASIDKRAVGQGWSLQAATCPADSSVCGTGACCPTGTHCQQAANSEVATCCSTEAVCRGAVEGAPTCADPSWSLWKGYQGNGFCCEVDLIGVYTNGGSTAGTCVKSASGDVQKAVLMTPGTGSSAPGPASSATAAATASASKEAPATASGTSTGSASEATAEATSSADKPAPTDAGNATASATGAASSTAAGIVKSTNAAGQLTAGMAGLVGAMALGLAM